MSAFRRFELIDFPSSLLYRESSAFYTPHSLFVDAMDDHLDFTLDLLSPSPSPLDLILPPVFPTPFDLFAGADELISARLHRAETELYLRSLSNRVAALELALETKPPAAVDRKYKWTAEFKTAEKTEGFDRKYKLIAEAKAEGQKNLKWEAEIKGKGRDASQSRTYTFEKSTAPAAEKKKIKDNEEKKEKKEKKKDKKREVEIEEPPTHGAIVLRQAFMKRTLAAEKGKKKELSPQDAALLIQMNYRAHLVYRSKALRALRDLAVAKSKLKEIRASFSNFSYRHRIAKDAEERQRFSEKIIVLLLTVEAIEGLDFMIRSAKRSMVDELEAMLEVVDPQPPGKLASFKRRQFDLPMGGLISEEMARGVTEVVQMLNEGDSGKASVSKKKDY